MTKRTKLLVLIACLATLALAYVWYDSTRARPLLVVVDAPLANKRLFDPSDMDATRLYFEETPNSAWRYEALYYDFVPEESAPLFEEALAQGAEFFITTKPSSLLTQSAHLFEQPGALIINTSATNTLMTGKDDYMLRIIADARGEQQVIAEYIHGLPGSRLLILQDQANAAYTDPAYEFFRERFDALGGWHVSHDRFLFERFDPSAVAALLDEPFDVLYLLVGEFQASTGNLAQLFHHHNPDAPIVLTPWARSDAIFENAGPAIDQLVMLSHHRAQADDPAIADYLQRFRSRFGYQPMGMALLQRQALEMLEQAYAQGHRTPSAVRRYLLSLPYIETSLGTIELDQYGDRIPQLHVITDLKSELRARP